MNERVLRESNAWPKRENAVSLWHNSAMCGLKLKILFSIPKCEISCWWLISIDYCISLTGFKNKKKVAQKYFYDRNCPKIVGHLGLKIIATNFKKSSKHKRIDQSGHTYYLPYFASLVTFWYIKYPLYFTFFKSNYQHILTFLTM